MAVTVTSTRIDNGLTEDKWGKSKIMGRRVTITGTYATGGFDLFPAAFGLRRIHTVIFNERGAPATSFTYHFNSATNKVQMFGSNGAAPAALAELANATSVGTRTLDIFAIGWA
jgi:hypothetical protein